MRFPRLQFRLRTVLAGVAIAAMLGDLSLRAVPPNGLFAADRTKSFAWFSSLDYPDVKPLDFVLATVPHSDEYTGRRYPPQIVAGFLVADGPKEFTFFTLGRETRTVAKSPDNAPPLKRSGYVRADLPEYVRFAVDSLQQNATKRRDGGNSPRFGRPPSSSQELFVLSWACLRKGYEPMAEEMFDRVVSLYSVAGWKGTPYELVTGEIRYTELVQTLHCRGDAKLTRAEMLKRCQRFAKVFPDAPETPRVNDDAKILARMIADDKRHTEKRAHGKPFDQLSKNEQIAELIFQLRDQTGFEVDNSGQSNIFATIENMVDDAPDGTTPAHRLLKYGYDALPQLVEALDNDGFSRAMEIQPHGMKEYALTIGDCAQRILSRITGHEFYYYGCMSQDGKTAKVKAAVNAWYADVRQRGEKQVLIGMVEHDKNSDAAKLLAEKYPDAALEPIRIGLARSADRPWLPAKFVRAAARIPGDAPIPFLLDRARNGEALDERLAAAVALVQRKRPEGVATLIAEWNRVDSSDRLFYSLILAMLDSGSADAINALADSQPHRPEKRSSIVNAIRLNDTVNALFRLKRGRPVPAKAPLSPEQLQAKDAVVKLLVKSLKDTAQVKGAWTGEYSDKWIPNVRICDIAGRDLNGFDPKRFPFDLEAPLEQREKSRLAIINAERK